MEEGLQGREQPLLVSLPITGRDTTPLLRNKENVINPNSSESQNKGFLYLVGMAIKKWWQWVGEMA